MREVKIPRIHLPSLAPSQLNTECYLGIESDLPHSPWSPKTEADAILMHLTSVCGHWVWISPHFLAIAVLGGPSTNLEKNFPWKITWSVLWGQCNETDITLLWGKTMIADGKEGLAITSDRCCLGSTVSGEPESWCGVELSAPTVTLVFSSNPVAFAVWDRVLRGYQLRCLVRGK